MNIGESLPRNAQHFPQKPAIVDAHRSVTFRDLHLRTNRLANYLRTTGIAKGDIVGLSCGSRAEHFETLFALAKIGAIAVPYDYHWSARECAASTRSCSTRRSSGPLRRGTPIGAADQRVRW